MIERIREVSLVLREDFGLKSHRRAIRSHSCPGDSASLSATHSFSAFLNKIKRDNKYNFTTNVSLSSLSREKTEI